MIINPSLNEIKKIILKTKMNELFIKEDVLNADLLFGQLWEISVDGMRLIDDDGNILLVNDAFCKIFNLHKEQ